MKNYAYTRYVAELSNDEIFLTRKFKGRIILRWKFPDLPYMYIDVYKPYVYSKVCMKNIALLSTYSVKAKHKQVIFCEHQLFYPIHAFHWLQWENSVSSIQVLKYPNYKGIFLYMVL